MKRRILVVDDEPELLFSLETLLIESGYEVVTAESVAEALLILGARGASERRPFGLALIDVQMPGVNGIELLRSMNTSFPKTCVLMLSGSGDRKTFEELEKAGNPEFLSKPFDEKELLGRIEGILLKDAMKTESMAGAAPAKRGQSSPRPLARRQNSRRGLTYDSLSIEQEK